MVFLKLVSDHENKGEKMSNQIQVGKSYNVKPRFPGQKTLTFSIITLTSNRARPYLGITDTGIVEFFDEVGKDAFHECGGHWLALDLNTEKDAQFILTHKQIQGF